jgi:hypothetical protein
MNNIIQSVAKELVDCYEHKTPLIFPQYHNTTDYGVRVSEQESRIFFAKNFLDQNIPFAVEVPTVTKHSFSGKGKRSGNFDMVTYQSNKNDFDYIIELKAHNVDMEDIRKDFEKMVMSECKCIWFHTLKNADSGTIPALLEKFDEALKRVIHLTKEKSDWVIAIVVLEKKELYKRSFSVDKSLNPPISFTISDFTRTSL